MSPTSPYHNYHFHGQKKNEEIIMIVRRHWLNIFIQYLWLIGILVAWMMSIVLIPQVFPFFTEDYTTAYWFFHSFFILFMWIAASLLWVNYYLDVWIITNLRIINVEQVRLFVRTVSELHYEKIQDVTAKVHGFLPTIFKYGDVLVQTAGEEPRFHFFNVPNPDKIKEQIVVLQKYINNKQFGKIPDLVRKKSDKGTAS